MRRPSPSSYNSKFTNQHIVKQETLAHHVPHMIRGSAMVIKCQSKFHGQLSYFFWRDLHQDDPSLFRRNLIQESSGQADAIPTPVSPFLHKGVKVPEPLRHVVLLPVLTAIPTDRPSALALLKAIVALPTCRPLREQTAEEPRPLPSPSVRPRAAKPRSTARAAAAGEEVLAAANSERIVGARVGAHRHTSRSRVGGEGGHAAAEQAPRSAEARWCSHRSIDLRLQLGANGNSCEP
mmetsp:Transcript_16715/g.47665  ORF Transcript_16715/g.47665 Transcript_16715/m.47665 type:complete len:236 (-) Transcript_16715:7-714(-)